MLLLFRPTVGWGRNKNAETFFKVPFENNFFIWIIHIFFDCKFSDDFFQQNENLNSRRLFLLFLNKIV